MSRAAGQLFCFHYIDSTTPLLANPKFQTSSRLLWLYSPVCVGPGRKTEYRFSHDSTQIILHKFPKRMEAC